MVYDLETLFRPTSLYYLYCPPVSSSDPDLQNQLVGCHLAELTNPLFIMIIVRCPPPFSISSAKIIPSIPLTPLVCRGILGGKEGRRWLTFHSIATLTLWSTAIGVSSFSTVTSGKSTRLRVGVGRRVSLSWRVILTHIVSAERKIVSKGGRQWP